MKIRRKKLAATVPSMAMGDIAFNLLIFFVILARVTDDSHLRWDPAEVVEVDAAGKSQVSVLIDVDNKYYVNGKQAGIAQIAPALSELFGEAPPEERLVLLKVHREATANHFEPIVEAISESGGVILHVLEEDK